MTIPQSRYDLPRIIFGVLFIAIMIVACFWVIQPFILGFAWAGMVVIATWPLLIKLQKILWGRRSLAVVVMTILLILLFILPISLLVSSVVDNSAPVVAWASTPGKFHIPDLAWLQSIPMIGDKIYTSYHTLVSAGGTALVAKVQPYFGQTATWFVAQAAHIGRLLLHCTLMLLFSVLLYARGEQVALGIRHFATRLGASRGDAAVVLAGQAIRAVALGVVVTALVQSVLGGIGLAITGIPAATLLTVLIFICCVAQLGPLLVLVPAIIWLYWSGDTTWGTVLLVWSCVVATLDNVLRPVLIRMGADLPMLLILSGVIGGLLAFGMIGLFIGPVVLAVSYRLLTAWMSEAPEPTADVKEVAKDLEQM
ncbi:putative inner membrane protein [Serratia grimesii]|jgi:predicted PurR-regulated permease PerM|uniref:AI-2E family transporter YdiK n=1 Tax=Serratia grimesii TaxID=82995 RepID=UPI002178BA8B|nr:AI-2E family transporter YdiK [Serratia grimesii]CAI1567918.1 putative inner membrane protein [Serratia grimesii]